MLLPRVRTPAREAVGIGRPAGADNYAAATPRQVRLGRRTAPRQSRLGRVIPSGEYVFGSYVPRGDVSAGAPLRGSYVSAWAHLSKGIPLGFGPSEGYGSAGGPPAMSPRGTPLGRDTFRFIRPEGCGCALGAGLTATSVDAVLAELGG